MRARIQPVNFQLTFGIEVAVLPFVSVVRHLAHDCDGSVVAVEYLILFTVIAMVVAVTVIGIGLPLIHHYRVMQWVLTSPVV